MKGGSPKLFDSISVRGERREGVSWETTTTFTCDAGCEGEGLYYSNARWYEPRTGRFITEDPARDGAAWYAYCYNNRTRHVDPPGLEWVESRREGNSASTTGAPASLRCGCILSRVR